MKLFIAALAAVGVVSAAAVKEDSNSLDSELSQELGGDEPAAASTDAPADNDSSSSSSKPSDDGTFAVGPADVKLGYHAASQYPIIYPHPFVYPVVHPALAYPYHPAFGAYPYAHPAFGAYPYHPLAAVHPAFGAYPYAHPAVAAAAGLVHPALVHPALAGAYPVHPALAHPAFYGGFAEESAEITDKSKDAPVHPAIAAAQEAHKAWTKAAEDHVAAVNKAVADYPQHVANVVKAHTDAAQAQYNQYASMMSQAPADMQYPGAPAAAPGTHPLLGGTMNPASPMGLPLHPYPYPMHTGLPNGPHAPRPFTPTGQYFPGQNALPYFPGGPTPLNPLEPTHFPGASNGDMAHMGDMFSGGEGFPQEDEEEPMSDDEDEEEDSDMEDEEELEFLF